MLSGGKDSCSLAFLMKDEGLNFFALTVDNGFLSDVARSNVLKVCEILDIPSGITKPPISVYREAVLPLVPAGMDKACGKCSSITIGIGHSTAVALGVKKIYAGFTKYTASAAGWTPAKEKELPGGVILVNPYYEKYDLDKIRGLMEKHGLELDPTKTNCRILPDILKATNIAKLPNHLRDEIDLLEKDGMLKDGEAEYYKKFVEQE